MLPTLLPNCCPAPQGSGYGKSTTAPHRSAELLGVRLLSVVYGSVIVNQHQGHPDARTSVAGALGDTLSKYVDEQ